MIYMQLCTSQPLLLAAHDLLELPHGVLLGAAESHLAGPCSASDAVQGAKIEGQLGFFAEWMHGVNPETLNKELKRQWIISIPIEWVRKHTYCTSCLPSRGLLC